MIAPERLRMALDVPPPHPGLTEQQEAQFIAACLSMLHGQVNPTWSFLVERGADGAIRLNSFYQKRVEVAIIKVPRVNVS